MRRSMAVCCWLVVFPFTASALGLGDISLNSALNQPFSAEIPVTSYEDSDLKDLKVSLASTATFDRYGLDLPLFLQDFEFAVAQSASGKPVVRVSSLRPVSEPFVTLLLDIKWSSGRLLREYTVLLDPPLFESEPVQSGVAAPAMTPTETVVAESASSGEVTRSAPPVSAPAPAPAPASAPVSARAPRPVAETPAAAAVTPSGDYAVQRRDTLWSIANRVRGSTDLTVNQVMLALYRANPEAFLGNINRLKAGAILRVPERSQLGELTPGEATAAVREQNAALSQPAGAQAAAAPARLTLVAPDSDGEGNAASADAPVAGATSAVESALDAAARSVESEQMRGRIAELEGELSESQRLIEARSAELAALQRRIQVLESREAAAGMDTAALDSVIIDDGVLVESDAPAEVATDEPSVFADEAVEDADVAAAADPVEPMAADDAGIPDAVTTVPAREESSFFGDLLSSIWFWISAAVVLLLALFIARRRATDADDDIDADATGGGWEAAAADADHEETMRDIEALTQPEESILVEEGTVGDRDGTSQLESLLDDFEDEAGSDANKTSQLSPIDDNVDTETPLEKTISTGPLNLDQADPVAEAEFHMAYGLYDQAAELLEAALESEPDNRAYRVKLIEVFFVWENREGFLKHATLLHDAIADDSDSDWNKVVILGKQLCADAALFSGAETAAPSSDSLDFEMSDVGDTELDFTLAGNDLPALSEDALSSGSDSSSDDVLDFDLGSEFDAGDDEVALDLGDDDFERGFEDDADTGAVTVESPTVEANRGDFADGESELDTLETPTIESPAVDHGDDDDELDIDLGEDLIDDAASTMETPTIESPMNEPTLESPTLESAGAGGETTEMPALDMEEFDPEELDFDLGGADDLDVDLSGLGDEDDDADDATLVADMATAQDDDDATLVADSADLEAEIEAELETQAGEVSSDTVEQPQIDTAEVELGDTAEQPAMVDAGHVDFDLSMDGTESEADDDVATAIQEASLPEDATMTEVGTKLDLARAYIDMGDPDGARSILDEVLEEGAVEQQQEARQLLEELGD